jgi:hypothetical protein
MSQFKKYLEIINEMNSREYMMGAINDAKANKIIRDHKNELREAGLRDINRTFRSLLVKYENFQDEQEKINFIKTLNEIDTLFSNLYINENLGQRINSKLLEISEYKQIFEKLDEIKATNEIKESYTINIKNGIKWVLKTIKNYEENKLKESQTLWTKIRKIFT